MLEVKHLKRIYPVKNAEPVYALNDISLRFPEKGLVFILGKSGSGKSTLLNVMGGLDVADEGEIIIDGKSSKDFSKGEMDSYRNTYLGFIFQEYNILSDFNVKENIALALQLQHKKATDEEVKKILEKVDLAGYGKRKPNELSGGQKQRVAIARALVKEPKIIFADEPTGALDSNTGKQVFDTLKKLSQDKLVVVVSHDRDFAERYGDRIIELKDGKVISDVSKTSCPSKVTKDGLSVLGDNLLLLDGNRPLTADDLPLINETIAKGKGDVFIVSDPHINESIRQEAKIDKNGNREEFVNTDADKIVDSHGSFEAIKSKFSLERAIKMGARSMKVKPFRLAMTILLSTFSFSLFGMSITASLFNTKDALMSVVKKEDMHYATLILSERGSAKGYSPERVKEIEDKTGSKIYLSYTNEVNSRFNTPSNQNDFFHLTGFSANVPLKDSFLNDFDFTLVSGKMPKDDTECLITLYEYYTYEDFGFGNQNDLDSIEAGKVTQEKIIGSKLDTVSNRYDSGIDVPSLTISGIVDTKLPEEFLKYRDTASNGENIEINSDLNSLRYGPSLHSSLFVGERKGTDASVVVSGKNFQFTTKGGKAFINDIGYYRNHKNFVYFDQSHPAALSKGEALLSLGALSTYLDDGSQENTYDFVFPGAYQTEEKEDDNLYRVSGISRFSLSEEATKEAAAYKTKCDKYSDFFDKHIDLVKRINEGNDSYSLRVIEPTYDDKGNPNFDYTGATDSQKYQIFSRYVDVFVTGKFGEDIVDKTGEYYSYYLSAIKTYQDSIDKAYPFDLKDFMDNYQDFWNQLFSDYLDDHYVEIYEKYKDAAPFQNAVAGMGEITDERSKKEAVKIFLNRYENEIDEGEELEAYLTQGIKTLIEKVNQKPFETILSYEDSYSLPLKVVGIDLDCEEGAIMMSVSKDDAPSIKESAPSNGGSSSSSYSYVAFGNDSKTVGSFMDFFLEKAKNNDYSTMKDGDWSLSFFENSLSYVKFIGDMLTMFTSIFLYIGIGLAAFSMLLFYNFISVSINNKKREIGILRAVGAKRADVFKIFYSEACIIALFNFVLSVICTFAFSFLMNVELAKNFSISFSVMNPNIVVVLAMFGVAFLAAFISSFLPVARLANKKPIDAIQNR